MFCRAILVFVILCGYVNSAKPRSILSKNNLVEMKKYDILQKEKMHKAILATKNNEMRTKKVRTKRGIVMVDSDFDIPSEIYTYEDNLHTDEVFGKNEGSGTGELDEKEVITTTEEDIKSESEHHIKINMTTVLTRFSTSTVKPTMIMNKNKTTVNYIDTEGSGDEISSRFTEEYSAIETTTKSHIKPDYDIQERIPDICLNSTCSTHDLSILSSEKSHFISEGTNFTLTCISSNGSNNNMLYWYKSNGSVYFLQAFGTEADLQFNIPDTKPIHSGIYMCVKWVNKQTCCNMQSNTITIYEVPLYQYHLIIVGLAAALCLFLCIFLSVRQSKALKRYTKQFAEKHGSVKNQLL